MWGGGGGSFDTFEHTWATNFPYDCLSVCLCLLRLHYTPLQRYMGYLCTIRAQYAPPRRNMHHGAQGRLCFLKNSGDPDLESSRQTNQGQTYPNVLCSLRCWTSARSRRLISVEIVINDSAFLGDRGPQGPTGMRGSTGYPGPRGPTGPRGFTGPSGNSMIHYYSILPYKGNWTRSIGYCTHLWKSLSYSMQFIT